jgi:hypothetical protein
MGSRVPYSSNKLYGELHLMVAEFHSISTTFQPCILAVSLEFCKSAVAAGLFSEPHPEWFLSDPFPGIGFSGDLTHPSHVANPSPSPSCLPACSWKAAHIPQNHPGVCCASLPIFLGVFGVHTLDPDFLAFHAKHAAKSVLATSLEPSGNSDPQSACFHFEGVLSACRLHCSPSTTQIDDHYHPSASTYTHKQAPCFMLGKIKAY